MSDDSDDAKKATTITITTFCHLVLLCYHHPVGGNDRLAFGKRAPFGEGEQLPITQQESASVESMK